MQTAVLTVLILGGYGTFGGRLAQLLADEPRLRLIIAGRSRERAVAFCNKLGGRAEAVPAVVERGDVADALQHYPVDILVDASGPFQAYGADPYGVVRACLANGVHYLDLADGADFVDGIAEFDAEAKEAELTVLSGMSSFPVLTVAVLDKLRRDMVRIDEVVGGIAPSPYAGVGLNVIRAIASYAGQRVQVRRDGHDTTSHALTESLNYTISPPGRLPLKATRFSLVDVPDLRVLPRRFPSLRTVWMGAGPVPEILHRAFNGLSWLVRWRLLPSLSFLAPVIDRVINVVCWGEHRGGMFVAVTGVDRAGAACTKSWHLLAEGDDGPLIPSMAVEAIVRKALQEMWPHPGARSGDGELSLADYEALFVRRSIVMGERHSRNDQPGVPLYRCILGDAWGELPEVVRALHDRTEDHAFVGKAEIRRGGSLGAKLAAWLFNFPEEGDAVPLTVAFAVEGRKETWRRNFGGRTLVSEQSEGRGRWSRLVLERFGPVRVGLALVVDEGRLRIVVRRWSLFGIPMPLALAPHGDSYETERDGRFHFHVEIRHRWTGLIVSYNGELMPEAALQPVEREEGVSV